MNVTSIDPIASPPQPVAQPAAQDASGGAKAVASVTISDSVTPPLDSDSAKALEEALNERIARLLSTNIRLQIDKDRDTGHFVYKSIDTKTGELHRQFPAADILRMLAFFKELDGLLYNAEA